MTGTSGLSTSLGYYQAAVEAALHHALEQRLLERIWSRDFTIWKPDPGEISNRLGWLDCPEQMKGDVPALHDLAHALQAEGFTDALLLGMGGSSLAPEVLAKTFGIKNGFLNLMVLDSTDPGAVQAFIEGKNPSRTLYIVSTKSGGTIETLSFFKFFYNHSASILGKEKAGSHFVAITDPGSSLAEIGAQFDFRRVYLNNPNIGGRYSALSLFGLLPGALLGLDTSRLLEHASREAQTTWVSTDSPAEACRALWLGTILGELAIQGRDKLTLITSPSICTMGDWIEQLVAESSGKEGQGIFPVVGEPVGNPDVYGNDRLFAYLRLSTEPVYDGQLLALKARGHPVVTLELADLYDLGSQFFLWEMATCIAGARLKINPFDQPDVETSKRLAREMVSTYQNEGSLPDIPARFETQGIVFQGEFQAENLAEIWNQFLNQVNEGGYIAIQAYVEPSPACDAALIELRNQLRRVSHLAVTSGYGPRYLHSTGQLHKGDAGNGAFIQLVASNLSDIPIPDQAGAETSSISFGILKQAQALGDYQALLQKGRKVIRFHLEGDYLVGLSRLSKAVERCCLS